MLKKILNLALAHKFLSGLFLLLVIFGGWWGYKKITNNNQPINYVLATVTKGTLINSVSGSGQISASKQIDLKAKASGNLLRLLVKSGERVKAGSPIAYLDASEALKSVRDAEANLTNAKLSWEKLNQPADQLSVLQAENSLTASRENKAQAKDDLEQAYENGFNAVSNAFLDLPTILAGLDNMLFANSFEKNQQNLDWYVNQTSLAERLKAALLRDEVFSSYGQARDQYTKNFDDYKTASRNSDKATIESLIDQTYETAKIISDTVKTANNFLDFVQDSMEQRKMTTPATMTTHQTNLNTYTGTTNSQLTSLLNIKQAIADARQTIIETERTIEEKTESLAKLKAGADPLDLKSQQLTIQQRENSLKDAKEKLADYTIRAPFSGLIAEMPVKQGDDLSSGVTVATLITEQWLAEISLNEIDAAKVKVGQKATLTFDAIADLSLSGQVAEVDSLGAVAQGVVSYNVKIALDAQGPEQLKSGMSVSVAIIIDSKTDVLTAPLSAVKTQGDFSYVELLINGQPQQRTVATGLSNDTMIEILSGLAKGDQVITSTVNNNSATSANNRTRQNQGPGGGMMFFR